MSAHAGARLDCLQSVGPNARGVATATGSPWRRHPRQISRLARLLATALDTIACGWHEAHGNWREQSDFASRPHKPLEGLFALRKPDTAKRCSHQRWTSLDALCDWSPKTSARADRVRTPSLSYTVRR